MLFLCGTAPFIDNLRALRLIAIKGAFMAKLYAFVTGSQIDISKFTKDSHGRLVQINDGRDVAFILLPLPDSWKVPQDLVPTWVKAREILGELRGTVRTLPDPALLLRPLRQREALRSSSLEGTYASPEDLLAYAMIPRRPILERRPRERRARSFQLSPRAGIGPRSWLTEATRFPNG